MSNNSARAKEILLNQYELVKSSRKVVFNFCREFKHSDYTKEIDGFGRGSICTTQTHIANTYIFWVANSVMNKSLSYHDYKPVELNAVMEVFYGVNQFMEEFINLYINDIFSRKTINIKDGNNKISATLLQIFTHVITHEFHHKGQIMSMGRLLGYVPPDADIIRFS